MSSNETVLVEDAVSKLYYLQFLSIGLSALERAFSTSAVSFEAIAWIYRTLFNFHRMIFFLLVSCTIVNAREVHK